MTKTEILFWFSEGNQNQQEILSILQNCNKIQAP